MEAREDLWSVSGEFIYTIVCTERVIILNSVEIFLTSWSKQKTFRVVSMIHGTFDGHRIYYESWSRSTRFRIVNNRPLQGYWWVDGRLTETQVTSRPETICPEVWSSVSKCGQKKAKQQLDIDNPWSSCEQKYAPKESSFPNPLQIHYRREASKN